MNANSGLWLSTDAYPLYLLVLLLAGHVAWAVFYLVVIRNIREHGAVEIPAAAIASSLACVTVWSVVSASPFGAVFTWIDRAIFVLQLAVFGYTLRNGARHVKLPEVRRWFKTGLVASYVCWLIMLLTFAQQGYDMQKGFVSASIVSTFMSSLYVLVELSDIDPEQYSLVAGWAKLAANLCAAAFALMVFPIAHFLLTMCAITVVLDVTYLLLFRQRRGAQPSRAPAGSSRGFRT